ncbi:MAG TPA: glycosyl hydrolase, partial [Luteolibacter sp.]|nr:glycosyl hydrolase [Luteolibacter sp.]
MSRLMQDHPPHKVRRIIAPSTLVALVLAICCFASGRAGAAPPTYRNLAKYQQAVGNSYGYTLRPELFATDGIASNYHRWRSSNATGQTLDITYPRAVTIASAHLYMGVMASGTATELWAKFKFQYDSGGTWVDVPGGSVTGNTDSERNVIFTNAVTSTKFRLLSTDTGSAVRSVRELAMFGPNLVGGVEQGYPIGTEVTVNLAHMRPATASTINGTNYALKAVDGYVDDSSRWLCNTGTAGEWLEIDLLAGNANGDAYQAISSARLYSGDFATSNNALSDFTLQYWDTVNSVWADIPGATITGNTQTLRTIPFSSVVATNKVRLVNNTTGSAKVAELQFFPPSVSAYPANQDARMAAPPTARWSDFGDATRQLRVSSASLKLGVVGGNAVFSSDSAGSDALNWQLLLNHRDGSYRIRNVKSGQCLALAALSTAANTGVITESYTGMPHQCWFPDFVNASQFRLLNAYSGLALQSLGASSTPGTALVVVAPDSSTLQQWDTVWQANYPKKGIAATGSAFPDVPGETWMSYLYGKYQHSSWSYSWGRLDNFPYMTVDHTFCPMQWGDYFWGHGTSTAPLEGDRVYMQSQEKPFSLLGFNEPDHTDQANMTVDRVVKLWPRLLSMDVPLVGPCPANPTSTWNADFYAA